MKKYDLNEANSIPILSIAPFFVEKFINKGYLSTGKCCLHSDNKIENLRFKIEDNYCHCFTCGNTWHPVSFVMAFGNMSFKEALDWLYQKFPNYFRHIEEIDTRKKWYGLSNKEYNWLEMSRQITIGNKIIDIRDLANDYPKEHDNILVSKILKKYFRVIKLEKILTDMFYANNLPESITLSRIKNDRNYFINKLAALWKKGLINDHGNFNPKVVNKTRNIIQ